MNISCREQREFNLVVRLTQNEADSLLTLLYQATSDLIFTEDQLLIANGLMAALKGNDNDQVRCVNET
jgi:hypothetical protein